MTENMNERQKQQLLRVENNDGLAWKLARFLTKPLWAVWGKTADWYCTHRLFRWAADVFIVSMLVLIIAVVSSPFSFAMLFTSLYALFTL